VALHDLGVYLHCGLELVEHIGRGAVEQHFHKDQHAGTQLERIEPRLVAQDEAVAREPLHARQHRRGRQGHGIGQLEVGNAPVFLQDRQYSAVDTVQIGIVVHQH